MKNSLEHKSISERFQHLFNVITSQRFLEMKGLGKEIPFFICPFPPEQAVEIKKMQKQLVKNLDKKGIRVLTIDLYDLSIELLKKRGIWEVPLDAPWVSFKAQIEDPENHPFPTPSGKIEIFSQLLADMDNPLLPPVPKYIESWEGRNDPLAAKYPLQMINSHMGRRANTVLENVPLLRRLTPHVVWINPLDAKSRGIENGEKVRVFNDRGEMAAAAKVTERIMPGVVHLTFGAHYTPDENGVDHGGAVNILTKADHSPGGALCTNTCLVEMKKA